MSCWEDDSVVLTFKAKGRQRAVRQGMRRPPKLGARPSGILRGVPGKRIVPSTGNNSGKRPGAGPRPPRSMRFLRGDRRHQDFAEGFFRTLMASARGAGKSLSPGLSPAASAPRAARKTGFGSRPAPPADEALQHAGESAARAMSTIPSSTAFRKKGILERFAATMKGLPLAVETRNAAGSSGSRPWRRHKAGCHARTLIRASIKNCHSGARRSS